MSARQSVFTIIVLSGIALQASAAATHEEQMAALKKGQPKAVASLIARMADCQHWRGEEPYDASRAKEMAAAMDKLRCDKLDQDMARLRKQFAHDPKVSRAIDDTRRMLAE